MIEVIVCFRDDVKDLPNTVKVIDTGRGIRQLSINGQSKLFIKNAEDNRYKAILDEYVDRFIVWEQRSTGYLFLEVEQGKNQYETYYVLPSGRKVIVSKTKVAAELMTDSGYLLVVVAAKNGKQAVYYLNPQGEKKQVFNYLSNKIVVNMKLAENGDAFITLKDLIHNTKELWRVTEDNSHPEYLNVKLQPMTQPQYCEYLLDCAI